MNNDFKLWLETESGDPVDQPANRPIENFCNATVTFSDSRVYAINIWTFDFLPLARREWPYENPDSELAKYLVAPDLFVEDLTRNCVEQSIRDMLGQGGLPDQWLVTDSLNE